MTMTADANKSPAASKGMNTTAMIWAAIAVFVTVMGASTAIFGLAGLVAVMVRRAGHGACPAADCHRRHVIGQAAALLFRARALCFAQSWEKADACVL